MHSHSSHLVSILDYLTSNQAGLQFNTMVGTFYE